MVKKKNKKLLAISRKVCLNIDILKTSGDSISSFIASRIVISIFYNLYFYNRLRFSR